jgi:hypothetical protein
LTAAFAAKTGSAEAIACWNAVIASGNWRCWTQVILTLVLAAVLVVLSLRFGHVPSAGEASGETTSDRGAWLVGVWGLAAGLIFNLASSTWGGFTLTIAVVIITVLGVIFLARLSMWGPRHMIALATGALLARAATGFLVDPIGDVAPAAKYAHNAFFLLGSAVLGALAWRQNPVSPAADARART